MKALKDVLFGFEVRQRIFNDLKQTECTLKEKEVMQVIAKTLAEDF